MRRILIPGLVAVVAAGLWLVQSPAAGTKTSAADQQFLKAADETDRAEIRLGKIAQQHGSSAAVKRFGERMIRDHSRMNKELRQLAGKLNVALPDKLDAKHQKLVDQLSQLKGAEFDRTYTKDMIPGHTQAIKKFEAEAQNGQDPAVKAWAAQSVSILQEHLRLARECVQAVKNEK